MAKYINIKLPPALEGARIDHNLGYYEPRFWVSDLKAAAISPQGAVFKNGLLLLGSLPERRRSKFKLGLYAYKQKVALGLRSLPDSKRYILGFNPYSSGNYYHWVTEALPRLWVNRKYFKGDDIVFIPDSGITIAAKASMSAIGFYRHEVLARDCMTYSSHVVLAQSSARQAEYHSSLGEMRDAILASLGIGHMPINNSDLLYVSRGVDSVRSVANEAQVVERLTREYGFTVIEPHQLTFVEQVAVFARARLVVSIHGAALTNLLWMQSGSSVIELYKHLDTYLGNVHTPPGLPSLCYLRLASVIGANHDLLQCDAKDSSASVNSASLIVDIDFLCSLISRQLRN